MILNLLDVLVALQCNNKTTAMPLSLIAILWGLFVDTTPNTRSHGHHELAELRLTFNTIFIFRGIELKSLSLKFLLTTRPYPTLYAVNH